MPCPGAERSTPLQGRPIELTGEAYARRRIFGDATDSAQTVIPGHVLVNASLGYRLALDPGARPGAGVTAP